MSKLDNRNKDLLELCRKQEKEIKELTLKLSKMKEDNKISAPSCEQLEGMKRLTEKKIVQPSCDINGELESKEYIYIKDKTLAEKKLFELEDIEEKLGIDLITLFKALEQKWAYCIYNKKICPMIVCIEYFKDTGFAISSVFGYTYKLKDYGKT